MRVVHRSARSAALAYAVAGVLANALNVAQAAEEGTLEEIIVTAERREQSLQDIPTAATVLNSEALQAQGVDNVIDLQQVAPSVAINTYNRGTFINIRGVGIAQSAPTSSPGVANYVDGVYIPHETFIAHSFYDIASVEVLRGPQGTFSGQNSTGGAIYMRTQAPSFDGFSGYIDQTVASYDWYRTVGAMNIPMGDKFAMRLAVVNDPKGSYTDNIGPSPSEPGSSKYQGVRVSLLAQPVDALTLDLRYEHFDLESDYNAIKNRNDSVTKDPFTIEEDAISFLNQQGYRASIEARIDVASDMQLRLLTSRLEADNEDQADGDRTATALPVPANLPTNAANTALYPGRVGLTTQSFESTASEINLLSTGDSNVKWIVGAFYFDETTPIAVLRDNRNTVNFVSSSSTILANADNKSWSGFGQVDIKFTDAFELDVGARYSSDEQDYTRYALPGPPPPGCFPCTTTQESSETTGRLGGKFYASEDVMYYATFSKGYKAGGVNLDPRLAPFEPETNEVIELGVKSTLADGQLRVNADVFFSDYDGIQLSALTQVAPGVILPNTLNGKAKTQGAELEMLGQFGQLGLNLGLAYLVAEFDGAQTFTNTETNQNEVVPDGRTLPFSPEVTMTAGVEYAFNFGADRSFTPRLQAAYMDEQYATPYPGTNTRVPSHVVADFRATLEATENLRIEGFVTNLFDKTYIAVQVQNASSAAGGIIYGAPRQFGGRLVYSF